MGQIERNCHTPKIGRQSGSLAMYNETYSQSPNCKEKSNKKRTPARPNKRVHQMIASPVTTQSDRMSPKAKYHHGQKISAFQTTPVKTFMNSSFKQNNIHFFPIEVVMDKEVCDAKAVPKVALEPPSPKLLPTPPKHWRNTELSAFTYKRNCVSVTQSLVSLLATSGFLLAAH